MPLDIGVLRASASSHFVPQLDVRLGYESDVAKQKAQLRLEPIDLAYLTDLARIGYGKGQSGVMRRFILNGITQALEAKVIPTRTVEEFGGTVEDEDDD